MRSTARMSPPVAVKVAAASSTSEAGGTSATKRRQSLVAMKRGAGGVARQDVEHPLGRRSIPGSPPAMATAEHRLRRRSWESRLEQRTRRPSPPAVVDRPAGEAAGHLAGRRPGCSRRRRRGCAAPSARGRSSRWGRRRRWRRCRGRRASPGCAPRRGAGRGSGRRRGGRITSRSSTVFSSRDVVLEVVHAEVVGPELDHHLEELAAAEQGAVEGRPLELADRRRIFRAGTERPGSMANVGNIPATAVSVAESSMASGWSCSSTKPAKPRDRARSRSAGSEAEGDPVDEVDDRIGSREIGGCVGPDPEKVRPVLGA